MVVMDPATGRVLAMVGGFSYDQSQFNRATQAMRQPGSSFKPFVYATALDNGYTPSTLVMDGPIEIDQGPGQPPWRPENYSAGKYAGPSTLRYGIEQSRNTMTVRLAQDVGMPLIVEYARRFGVYDNLPAYLSFSLGAGETTVLRMVTAYSMFDNGGKRIIPTFIDRIQDRYGRNVYKHDQRECKLCMADKWKDQTEPSLVDRREQVLDPMTAYQITSIMEGVVQRGTATVLREVGKPVAGKTGLIELGDVSSKDDLKQPAPRPGAGRRPQGAIGSAIDNFFSTPDRRCGRGARHPMTVEPQFEHKNPGFSEGLPGLESALRRRPINLVQCRRRRFDVRERLGRSRGNDVLSFGWVALLDRARGRGRRSAWHQNLADGNSRNEIAAALLWFSVRGRDHRVPGFRRCGRRAVCHFSATCRTRLGSRAGLRAAGRRPAFHAGDGSLVADHATRAGSHIPIQAVPKMVINGFLAAEDKNPLRAQRPRLSAALCLRRPLALCADLWIGPSAAGRLHHRPLKQVAQESLLTNEVSPPSARSREGCSR